MSKSQLLETILKYSKEVFVIFIGVSISFFVDRCKNDMQDRDNERLILQNLRFDLQKDSFQLLSQTQYQKETLAKIQKLYDNIDNIDNIDLMRDSVQIFAFSIAHSLAFTPVDITFEEIKQNGLSKIITNTTLKRKIFELYCNDYEDLKIMNTKVGNRVDNVSFPYLVQHMPYSFANQLDEAQFQKVKKMCAEDTFKLLLKSAVKDSKYSLEFYQQATQSVNNLLEMLRKK
jgi:hypothetical protein